jgi:hypothetical protein
MAVTPPCDTPVVTTQLRLLNGGELPKHARRTRTTRAHRPARVPNPPVLPLDARTREIGQSGVAEARRRLAEIMATTERVGELVRAS